ncbi:hypothetical protein Sme01_33780 [Sphaerisporangium melleum]|uniref:Uncharacterized protein n=1 Tax=Sphaerisporangium melleum TaxID=321316 RepID=A0A917VGS5_9ACTN|nr:hypothetical protein [Sphaerisporangium melleum]GGK74320.1 hypothetical protein GCM10007964_16450 [Sphaerisporangium melleum]GII70902.1 hypothetical protein Sme01_33780 [Sphaerisporangium melleum]
MASETESPADGVLIGEGATPIDLTDQAEVTDESFAQVSQVQTVINHIHGNIGGASFGISGSRTTSRRTSGPVSAYEMAEARTCYKRHDTYEAAAEQLGRCNMVALIGTAGTGRRTAALNLLHDFVGGRREAVVELSPAYTLEKLAAREYRKAHGYLLCDWPMDDIDGSIADFHVREIRRRVRDAGAYLVITGTTTSLPKGDQILWQPLSACDVLLAHQVAPEIAAEAAAQITPELAVADVVALARDLARGVPLDNALGRLESVGRRDVVAWFDCPRTRGELFEMAAMAFTAGLPEAGFESLLARLESIAGIGAEKTDAVSADDPMPSRRLLRVAEGSLFSLSPGRRLEFKVASHRTHVMRELYQRHGMRLWEPVTEWLHECAALRDNPSAQAEIARGVAILASVSDYSHVDSTFLTPWARGRGVMRSQATAAMAISWLCLDETTRPEVLRTVSSWTRASAARPKFTAALAWSGELGIRFPLEAVRMLWLQIRNSEKPVRHAEIALARLFVALTEATGNALPILDWLARQISNDRRIGRAVDPLIRAILSILSAPADGVGLPTVTAHLRSRPDSAAPLAKLWSAALVKRPHRRDALTALYDAVCAFDERDDDDRNHVRALFAALVETLPAKERPLLAHDLRRYAISRNTDENRLEILLSLLRVFLNPAVLSLDTIGKRP